MPVVSEYSSAPQRKRAPKRAAKKKAPAKKAKPVEYQITTHDGVFHTQGTDSKYHAGLLSDGFFHENTWYPPASILKVERRTP